MSIEEDILEFEKAHKSFAVAYGGDGTLLDVAFRNDFKKALFPIRDYGLCDEHADIFNEVLGKKPDAKSLKQTLHPLLKAEMFGFSALALSELTLKNEDPTSCIRLNLLVNGALYMENIICDGVIFSTSLGSHGYFKSVTRTIFKEGIGIGFICPTYGISNLVLKPTDKISVQLVRSTTAVLTADKRKYHPSKIDAGSKIDVAVDPTINQSIFGYDIFCCPACRKNRNSTIINDQYLG